MTSKRKEQVWSEVIQVLVTPKMKEQIKQMAAEDHVSASSFARQLLKEALVKEDRKRKRRKTMLDKENQALYAELTAA